MVVVQTRHSRICIKAISILFRPRLKCMSRADFKVAYAGEEHRVRTTELSDQSCRKLAAVIMFPRPHVENVKWLLLQIASPLTPCQVLRNPDESCHPDWRHWSLDNGPGLNMAAMYGLVARLYTPRIHPSDNTTLNTPT